MVFFVLTTAPQGGFGNYFLPIQIGAEDMAFPVLNMLSFWVTFVGFIVILLAIFAKVMRPSAVVYRPGRVLAAAAAQSDRSAAGQVMRRSVRWANLPVRGRAAGMNLWIISIAIFCVGSLLGALNFITTLAEHAHARNVSDAHAADVLGLVHDRGAGVAFISRCCSAAAFCCCWIAWRERASSFPAGLYVSGSCTFRSAHRRLADSLATPVLVLRPSGSLHRDPARHGRDFAHPGDVRAQAGLWLSRDGVCHLRDRPAGFLRLGPPHVHQRHESVLRNGFLDSDACRSACLRRSRRSTGSERSGAPGFASPRRCCLRSGSCRCSSPAASPDWCWDRLRSTSSLHDTYFVTAHFHLVMGVASIFGMFAATYFWFPKMFGRMMSEGMGKFHFWITFIGVYASSCRCTPWEWWECHAVIRAV